MQRWGLVILIILFHSQLFSQKIENLSSTKYWALTMAYGQSSARLPSGVGIVYPGPPFWAGDLKVSEAYKNSLSFEVLREFGLRRRNILLENSFGFTSLGFITNYDYDYENSINNIVRSERGFHYFSLSQKIKYIFELNASLSVIPSGGIFISYLTQSKDKNTNYMRGGGFRTTQVNYLTEEDRVNYGYEVGSSIRIKTTKVTFEVKPFYRSYYKSHYGDFSKKVFLLGVGLSVFLPGKSHHEETNKSQ